MTPSRNMKMNRNLEFTAKRTSESNQKILLSRNNISTNFKIKNTDSLGQVKIEQKSFKFPKKIADAQQITLDLLK